MDVWGTAPQSDIVFENPLRDISCIPSKRRFVFTTPPLPVYLISTPTNELSVRFAVYDTAFLPQRRRVQCAYTNAGDLERSDAVKYGETIDVFATMLCITFENVMRFLSRRFSKSYAVKAMVTPKQLTAPITVSCTSHI